MPKKSLERMQIPKLDEDLFSTEKSRQDNLSEHIINIQINQLEDFPEHPFKVKDDEEMSNLIDSVLKVGVIQPIVVREKENGNYEMISGHRRKLASEKLGLSEVPCVVRSLTDDEVTLIMVDTNLRQRQNILLSEKAWAYKLKYDVMKKQGSRTDLTSAPLEQKLTASTGKG